MRIYAEFNNGDFTRTKEKSYFLESGNNRYFYDCSCGTCSFSILENFRKRFL